MNKKQFAAFHYVCGLHPISVEEKCVASADAMAHIDQIPPLQIVRHNCFRINNLQLMGYYFYY